jgi:hypothetical protein
MALAQETPEGDEVELFVARLSVIEPLIRPAQDSFRLACVILIHGESPGKETVLHAKEVRHVTIPDGIGDTRILEKRFDKRDPHRIRKV